jgi:hypothetical protein
LHFLYEWLGEPTLLAPFSAVNESTWEHMKILYWPMFFFTIVQALYFKEYKDFWAIKLKGILLGLILIPTLFYSYNMIIEESPSWVNISIFYISAAAAYFFEAISLNKKARPWGYAKICINLLCFIGAFFIITTFSPLELEIFRDPTTGLYGK